MKNNKSVIALIMFFEIFMGCLSSPDRKATYHSFSEEMSVKNNVHFSTYNVKGINLFKINILDCWAEYNCEYEPNGSFMRKTDGQQLLIVIDDENSSIKAEGFATNWIVTDTENNFILGVIKDREKGFIITIQPKSVDKFPDIINLVFAKPNTLKKELIGQLTLEIVK